MKPADVFVNVPFDSGYERNFLALVAGLVALGRTPRCVLELPASTNRLRRIVDLIKQCPVSFHDVSRVTSTRTPQGLAPRFNMPFELGLAVARSREGGGSHRFFVLEARRYRLQSTLSDMNGSDPLIHHDRPHDVLRCVLDALGVARKRQPTLADLRELYSRLEVWLSQEKRAGRISGAFGAHNFRTVVAAATRTAQDMGLI